MQIIFSKIYNSMPSYLSQESLKNEWKCGLHISDKSGVTVVDFVQTYNNDNSPISFDTSKIPTKEAIESGIVDFEKIYNAQVSRQKEYPSMADQLDDLYHNGIDGWKATIKTTKDKYPKG
jgi:hypothetical protein